jgi:hypothetical protein
MIAVVAIADATAAVPATVAEVQVGAFSKEHDGGPDREQAGGEQRRGQDGSVSYQFEQ